MLTHINFTVPFHTHLLHDTKFSTRMCVFTLINVFGKDMQELQNLLEVFK